MRNSGPVPVRSVSVTIDGVMLQADFVRDSMCIFDPRLGQKQLKSEVAARSYRQVTALGASERSQNLGLPSPGRALGLKAKDRV